MLCFIGRIEKKLKPLNPYYTGYQCLLPLCYNATIPVYVVSSAWRPPFWVEIRTKIGLFSSKLSFIDIIRVLLNCHNDYGHFDTLPEYICF